MRFLISALLVTLTLTGCDTSDDDLEGAQRFRVVVENVAPAYGVLKSGVFDTPEGDPKPAPIFPGGAYQFSFTAGPNVTPGSGMRLSLATMFIQSNDLFYAFPADGLALYDANGAARTGDVTSELVLFDAGTEVNQTPGIGSDQAPRQAGPDTGTPENGVVTRLNDGDDDAEGYSYPDRADVIRVTLAHDGDTQFTVRIANVSTPSTLSLPDGSAVAVPLSPGAWAVHTDAVDAFTLGQAAPAWIEAIAEDGNPAPGADFLGPLTGVTVPLSPGTAAVHTGAVTFFASGAPASAGIEGIAEDGSPDALTAALQGLTGVRQALSFTTPEGASAPSPIGPGGSYAFEVNAQPGDRLSLATMYIQSNDLFLSFPGEGLALFDGTAPLSGDVSDQIRLYDAGTEVDEEPGVGRNQAPRQPAPDTGADENGTITRVTGADDGWEYAAPSEVLRVTVTPINA